MAHADRWLGPSKFRNGIDPMRPQLGDGECSHANTGSQSKNRSLKVVRARVKLVEHSFSRDQVRRFAGFCDATVLKHNY